ncbi:ribosomal protein S18-alanine N-acetyltransferase [Candidatus Albibeggiatoa sp. nov. NOAA]|uniref:ribosomal protein S18-alanine N-acetyltransferase n=1 Tax=Candidatus Albibeggiatoa sp. nov. NOAA TaxID=3162724 RepID=UPI0033034CA4|nr:ribosomal protein S18-alanine N-acetyltransferase [Thiotrichaceae bacterium]
MSAVLAQPELVIRPMLEADLTDIMLIESAAYPFPWTQRIFQDCFKKHYYNFVLEDNQVLLGYALMLIAHPQEAHILNICIHPDYQNCGYGRILLNYLLDSARAKEVDEILLEVRPSNEAAIRLYHAMGFNQIGVRRNYYPAKEGRENALMFGLSL